MTLLQLQYFKTLAHVLHYTQAAAQLHIAQPSLSYSIKELEKELGIDTYAVNWPIGSGKEFQGVYDRRGEQLLLFSGVRRTAATSA